MQQTPASKGPSRSIVFLTENEHASSPLVKAMSQEKFTVNLHAKSPKCLDRYLTGDMDMFIIESSMVSLEELSEYTRLRATYKGLLVLLIDEIDEMLQVMLFEQGIDDLLVKPLNPLLMLARIRAMFRRTDQRNQPSSLLFNGLEINGSARRVSFHGQELVMSSREFDLLWYMAKNAHTTLDRELIYKNVFGIQYNGYDRSADMYISRIRQKLEQVTDLPAMIKTVRGKGYLFYAD
jgi:two-component system response regulator RstA